jgi:hypothetical protein
MSILALANCFAGEVVDFRRLTKPVGDWHLPLGRYGGANRDRTDDLKLAKLALSQLSYGPVVC